MEIINKRFSTNKTLRNFYNPLHKIFNLSPGYYFLCKYGNYISKLIQKLILTKNGFSKSKIPKSLNPTARGKVPI